MHSCEGLHSQTKSRNLFHCVDYHLNPVFLSFFQSLRLLVSFTGLIHFLIYSCNSYYRMFYLFFESRNSKKDPVVIWLTGGPGCSSELAMFYENGPFQIANNLSLVWNEYGWDKVIFFFTIHPYSKSLFFFFIV